ncbi:MAG: hypothetical protein Q9208_001248 [Pyrenodesmia sp. 3 TL-2023]
MKTLTLHAHDSGPNPYKVAIVLENLKIPYELKLWDFGDGENGLKGPNFLKINENGRVPALGKQSLQRPTPSVPSHLHKVQHPGTDQNPTINHCTRPAILTPSPEDPNSSVLAWESTACINHLLRTYDTSYTLHPNPSTASPQDLVDNDKWTSFLTTTLGPMMGQLNWYVHYNATKNEDARARYEAQVYRCFDVLEGQLEKSGGKSVLPDGFGAVDCHFYPWVNEWTYGKLDIGKYEKIRGWLKVVGERPEVKKIYEEIPKAEKAFKG